MAAPIYIPTNSVGVFPLLHTREGTLLYRSHELRKGACAWRGSRRGVKQVCAGPCLSSTLASAHSLSKLSSALTLCRGWGEKEERARAPALEDLHSEIEMQEVQLY